MLHFFEQSGSLHSAAPFAESLSFYIRSASVLFVLQSSSFFFKVANSSPLKIKDSHTNFNANTHTRAHMHTQRQREKRHVDGDPVITEAHSGHNNRLYSATMYSR